MFCTVNNLVIATLNEDVSQWTSLSPCPCRVTQENWNMAEQCLCCLWVLLASGFSVPVSCLSRRVNSLVPTHSFTTTKFLFKSNFTNSLAGLLLFIVCSFDIKTMICYFLASHDICNIFNSTCTRLVESHFLSDLVQNLKRTLMQWSPQPGSQFNAATGLFPITRCWRQLFNCRSTELLRWPERVGMILGLKSVDRKQ